MSLAVGEEFPLDDTHAPGIIDHTQTYIANSSPAHEDADTATGTPQDTIK